MGEAKQDLLSKNAEIESLHNELDLQKDKMREEQNEMNIKYESLLRQRQSELDTIRENMESVKAESIEKDDRIMQMVHENEELQRKHVVIMEECSPDAVMSDNA